MRVNLDLRTTGRIALLLSLALAWLNLALTTRWAAVPGAVNGPKFPYFVAALACASILAWRARPTVVPMRALAIAACLALTTLLGWCFFTWFPPGSWGQIPFVDDWPPRYTSTIDAVHLLARGAFTGWRWTFLGGYPISTDVTQDLALWAALPVALLGAEPGFHATHLVLFFAIPALIWLDLAIARESADVRWLATGLAALFATGYSYPLIRSGDTNSLAGAVAALAAFVAAHAARSGRRGGAVGLVAALTLTYNSHRGFFVYALMMLALDAAMARDLRSLARATIAALAAVVVSLPRTWDLWIYPAYYVINNVELNPAPFSWPGFLRKVYYNVELLVQPGRWSNDPNGLATIYLPLLLVTAWHARHRPRFFAAASIAVLVLIRFNYSAFGYAFIRPIYLLPILLAPSLAWFVARCTGGKALATALLVVLGLHVQIWLQAVPHVASVTQFNADLVARVGASDGALVLIENAFHRDVDVDPVRESIRTPFDIHYEALVPSVTGKRLYGGMWDGWQWTPYRDQMFASGTFRGRALNEVPLEALTTELHRWGVTHLYVWSDPAKGYLARAGSFERTWTSGIWEGYEFRGSNPSPVVVPRGTATMTEMDPFGARIAISNAIAGDRALVRMNYHPAWQAEDSGAAVPLVNDNGQIAFDVPRSGESHIALIYPRPLWTWGAAFAAFAIAVLAMRTLAPTRTTAGAPDARR